MIVAAVHPDDLPTYWPMLVEGLDDMLKQHSLGRYTALDVFQLVSCGEFGLFTVIEGDQIQAALTCQILDGHEQILEVGMCWGVGAADWIEEIDQAFDIIGRQLGCSKIALNGRPGWRKYGKQLGYTLNSITLTRDIDHG